MKIKNFVLIILFFISYSIVPQAQSALPFLSVQQSPFLQGAGQTGVAIVSNDPLGFYYNPAILGFTAKSNHISFLFLPEKVEWIGLDNIKVNSYGSNLGYNFEKSIPLSIGIGFIHNSIKYDNYIDDSFNSFSIGASLNYPVSFSFGFSLKKFNSIFWVPPFGPLPQTYAEASGIAYDIGALLNFPVSELLFKNARYDFNNNLFVTPEFNYTLGYSVTNLGKEIYYTDPAQSDPIPRTARLGYLINLGFNLNFNNKIISFLDYTFVAEASDILIQRDNNGALSYKGPLGDINIGKNLIQLKYDNNTLIHKGHIFNLFETVKIAFGNFIGKGYEYNVKTSSLVFSTNGLFKLLSEPEDSSVLGFITNHIGLEYTTSNVFKDVPIETNYKAISIFYKNFDL